MNENTNNLDLLLAQLSERAKQKSEGKTKILLTFVCTGNTCRSPMAEFMFKQYLRDKKAYRYFEIKSAGLYAQRGDSISEYGKKALELLNTPYNKDRKARVMSVELSHNSDIIIGMSAAHAIRAGERAVSIEAFTGAPVPDPYGGDLNLYVQTAKFIASGFDNLYVFVKSAFNYLP